MVDPHPAALVALTGAVPNKQLKLAKDAIAEESTATVELLARVSGVVTRGAATERAPTTSLLSKAMIAELCRRLGVTRTAFEATMRELATDAILEGKSVGGELVEANRELLLSIDQIERELIAVLPKKRMAGAIKVVAKLDLVEAQVA